MAYPSSAAMVEWWKPLGHGEYVECRDQDGTWCLGVIKNQSMRGVVDVHLIGRHTSLDRKLEPSDCNSQLRPLWSSQYNDSILRHLEGKGITPPDSTTAAAATAMSAEAAEEQKDGAAVTYPTASWLTSSVQPTADSNVSVAQSTSDASWFLARPKMWVEGIDADGEWWPANITQSHPVKGVNLHFLGKSAADDRWVEPSAASTLLRPLPRAKPKQYTDELWDELQRRLSKHSKQPTTLPVAAVAEERKDHIAPSIKTTNKLHSPAPPPSTGEARNVTPLAAKHKAAKPQSTSPPTITPTIASSTSDRKRTASISSSSSGSPTRPAPPNAPMPMKLVSSPITTHEYHDTYQTPGKEETHPLTVTHSKRAIVEQLNSLQARHDGEIAQLRDELAAVRLDNSRLQTQVAGRATQPPPAAQGAADLLIVHTLHERYNRAVSRLESELPVVSDELLSELRGLVDWHLDMTGRLNRLLRAREADMAAALPSYD